MLQVAGALGVGAVITAVGYFFGPPSKRNSKSSARYPMQGNSQVPRSQMLSDSLPSTSDAQGLTYLGLKKLASEEYSVAHQLFTRASELAKNSKTLKSSEKAGIYKHLVESYTKLNTEFPTAEGWAETYILACKEAYEEDTTESSLKNYVDAIGKGSVIMLKLGSFKKFDAIIELALDSCMKKHPLSPSVFGLIEFATNSFHQQMRLKDSLKLMKRYLDKISREGPIAVERAIQVAQRAATLTFVSGKHEEAEDYLTEALTIASAHNYEAYTPSLYCDLATCIWEQGYETESQEQFEAIKKIRPHPDHKMPLTRSTYLSTLFVKFENENNNSKYMARFRINRVLPCRKEGDTEEDILTRRLNKFFAVIHYENPGDRVVIERYGEVASREHFDILSGPLRQATEKRYYMLKILLYSDETTTKCLGVHHQPVLPTEDDDDE